MIKTFIKKPVRVQAVQWTGDNYNEVSDFIDEKTVGGIRKRRFDVYGSNDDPDLVIYTLEGDHHARIGDWIIREINGDIHQCESDIFEKNL